MLSRRWDTLLQTLKQVMALTDATGGHPELRSLPDGVIHCPACGSEVLPLGAGRPISDRGKAYLYGWLDGRFGEDGSFADNPNLARREDPSCRLDYYKGHRKGREARRARERERSSV